MRIRIPPPFVLSADPTIGPLLVLEVALLVAGRALRAWHPAAEGDFDLGEDVEITIARILINESCHLREELLDYRTRVFARLRRESIDSDWAF